MSGVARISTACRRLMGLALMRWLRPLLPPRRHLALRYFVETGLFGWEREVRSLHDFVRGGPVAIDVGANWGIWTYGMARSRLFERIVSLEPNRNLATELESAALPGVELRAEAASDRSGNHELKIPVRGGQRLEGWATVEDAPELSADALIRLSVPSCTLDSLALAGVRFIKIDVEGHELAVLHGARETIKAWRPDCLIECKAARLAVAEAFFRDLGVGYQRVVVSGRQRWTLSPDNHFFSSRGS